MLTRSRRHRIEHMFAAALISIALVACGGGSSSPKATEAPQATAAPKATAKSEATAAPKATAKPEATAIPQENNDLKVEEAVFAKSLTKNMEPDEVAKNATFNPGDTVALSLKLAGRPKSGIIEATYYWGDEKIDSAEIDLADINGSVIISIGENTFLGFTLAPQTVWPISKTYHVDVTVDGKELDSYAYQIVAEDDGLKTEVAEVVLAGGADENYSPIDTATEFKPSDKVFLVGSGNFSKGSWLRSEWYVDGKIDKDGNTMVGPLEEDTKNNGFAFSFLPENGWPIGKQGVTLFVNDKKVGTYTFTITDTPDTGKQDNNVDEGVSFGELESFTHDSGVFTIKVPNNWEKATNDDQGRVNTNWIAPEDTAGIFVNVITTDQTLDKDQLSEFAKKLNDDVFGNEPGYEASDPEEQQDGSILLPFLVTPEINQKSLKLSGLTYVEQRGNKLSTLTVVYPYTADDVIWEKYMKAIVNSYQIDENAEIP